MPTNIATAQAGANGQFSVTLPSPAGTWVITAAEMAAAGATGYAQVTITSAPPNRHLASSQR